MNHPCLIHHFLEESARRFPDKVALIHKDVRAPYDRINSAANQLASYLRDQELNSGDRVVLALENCLEYVVSYYGVLKAGGVIVPISSDIKPDGLAPLLHELDPACIISSSKVEKTLQAIDLDSSNLLSLILRDPGQKWDSCNFPMIAWEDIIGNGTTPNLGLDRQAQRGDAVAPQYRFQHRFHLQLSAVEPCGHPDGGPALLLCYGKVPAEHPFCRWWYGGPQQHLCFPGYGGQGNGR